MGYASHGHEVVIATVLLLTLFHLVLDLLPKAWQTLREACVTEPAAVAGRFLLIVAVLFLM